MLRCIFVDVSYSRESSLSEARRLKILKFSNCNISQLDRIAMELLETERCYVNDLNDVIQVIFDCYFIPKKLVD